MDGLAETEDRLKEVERLRRGFGRMQDGKMKGKEKGEMREILQYYTDYNLNERSLDSTVSTTQVRINTH